MRDTRVGVHRTPVRSAARFVARHPRSTGSVVVLNSAGLWAGYQAVLMAAGVAVVAGVSWRLLDQPTFDRFAGRLLRAWWRRWLVYQRQWQRVVFACNLTTTDHRGNTLVPKLLRVRSAWVWDSLHIRLAKGQQPEDFEEVLGRLAMAFKARAAAVRLLKPGKIALDFQRREPFDEMLVPLPELGETADEVDLGKLVIGRDEYGRDFGLNLHDKDLHILLGGETGAGKGSWLWALLRTLAPLLRAGHARLWVIDPKGGMEFSAGRPLFHRFADNERDGLALLAEYVETLDRTKLQLGRGGHRTATPSADTPLEVLIIDELAALTAYGSRDIVRAAEPLLSKALTQYRAVLGRVIAATQEPDKNTVPMRGLFPTRIALRLASASYVDMCLGEGMRDMGALADKIPAYLPGVAYVKKDGRREPLRVRAAYTSDDDIAELVRFCTSTDAAVIPLHRDTTTTATPPAESSATADAVDFTAWEVEDEDVEEIPEDEWTEGDEDIA
ncbi:FtsK/SpoIIIE domain-containing protein [Saccharomonospora xinjiangensis]|uniref:DNA segregation ATPase, FtsK/SpoIIIE family n=1 Tax=Saccharomonospora xinjiangensis XJ-54 TaxID=882086 RepID=I0V4S6_9PSEU|nr:FtsK/SpoIIIE domain-containing protein [Saccharomonospora xinjiangensis]EID55129.1 DNA segregation ATPase, FtsK/SpoIIIE family [Saccharomonospora xinjiangensis XJ-54]